MVSDVGYIITVFDNCGYMDNRHSIMDKVRMNCGQCLPTTHPYLAHNSINKPVIHISTVSGTKRKQIEHLHTPT